MLPRRAAHARQRTVLHKQYTPATGSEHLITGYLQGASCQVGQCSTGLLIGGWGAECCSATLRYQVQGMGRCCCKVAGTAREQAPAVLPCSERTWASWCKCPGCIPAS